MIKYALLAMVSGVMISVMVTINGELTGLIGNYPATVIIHVVGLCAMALAMLALRKKLHPGPRLPWYLYMGGVVGVGSVLMNNYTYAILGVSITLALGLLGQLVFSIAIDQLGLFGMPRLALRRHKLVSVGIVLVGIVAMMLGGN